MASRVVGDGFNLIVFVKSLVAYYKKFCIADCNSKKNDRQKLREGSLGEDFSQTERKDVCSLVASLFVQLFLYIDRGSARGWCVYHQALIKGRFILFGHL